MTDQDEKGKSGGGDWLQELSELRRSTQGVTVEDQKRWEDEAHRSRQPQEPTPAPPPDDPWKRLREEEAKKTGRRRAVALVALALAGSIAWLVWHQRRGGQTPSPTPSPESTPAASTSPGPSPSAASFPVMPTPTPSPEVVLDSAPPPASLDESDAAWHLALATLEIRLVGARERPHLLDHLGDLSELEGPAAELVPETESEPLALARRALAGRGTLTSTDLLSRLTRFASGRRPPLEQALVLYLAGSTDQAVDALGKAGQAAGPSAAALRAMCKLAAGAGPDDVARELPATTATAKDAWAASASALVLATLGRLPAALEALGDWAGRDAEVAFRRALLLRLSGDAAGLKDQLTKIHESKFDDAPRAGAALLLAQPLLQDGNKDGARALLEPFSSKQLPASLRAALLSTLACSGPDLRPSNPLLVRAEHLDVQSAWVQLALAKAFSKPPSPNLVEAIDHYQAYLERVRDPAIRRELIDMALHEKIPTVALSELSVLARRGEWKPEDAPRAEAVIKLLAKPASIDWLAAQAH